MNELPYCQAQVGGMECGRPVSAWGIMCEYHTAPKIVTTSAYKEKLFKPDPNDPMGVILPSGDKIHLNPNPDMDDL